MFKRQVHYGSFRNSFSGKIIILRINFEQQNKKKFKLLVKPRKTYCIQKSKKKKQVFFLFLIYYKIYHSFVGNIHSFLSRKYTLIINYFLHNYLYNYFKNHIILGTLSKIS